MIRYQKLSSGAATRPGRRRLISLSRTVSPPTASRPSRRNSGLKPISSSSPEKSTGIDSTASPTSCVWARHRELSFCEPQPQGSVALGHEPGSAHDVEQGRARRVDLDLERLGKQLLVVRELAVDAPAREPDVPGGEDHVVLVHAELDLVRAARDAHELLQRAGRNDRLELRPSGRQRRLLDRQAIRVGGAP